MSDTDTSDISTPLPEWNVWAITALAHSPLMDQRRMERIKAERP